MARQLDLRPMPWPSKCRSRGLCLCRHCLRPASGPRSQPDFQVFDDTYLVVPGVVTDTCQGEIEHLQAWAAENLKLNRDKTKEIVFSASRKATPLPPRPDFERVPNLRVLDRRHCE